jgi:hypothetical protein
MAKVVTVSSGLDWPELALKTQAQPEMVNGARTGSSR